MDQEVERPYVWYQQGDLTIKPVPKIPHRATAAHHRVLAGGETGRQHIAAADDVSLFLHEETLFMRAPTGTTVVHQERQALKIPPGDYVIGLVRKYDHFAVEADELSDW
jgi:hypothetical protein